MVANHPISEVNVRLLCLILWIMVYKKLRFSSIGIFVKIKLLIGNKICIIEQLLSKIEVSI